MVMTIFEILEDQGMLWEDRSQTNNNPMPETNTDPAGSRLTANDAAWGNIAFWYHLDRLLA